MDNPIDPHVRQYQRNLINERAHTLATNSANTGTLPKEGVAPSSPKSSLVLISLLFFAVSILVGALAAVAVSVSLGVFGVILGLNSVYFAVLSLRETA